MTNGIQRKMNGNFYRSIRNIAATLKHKVFKEMNQNEIKIFQIKLKFSNKIN